MTDAAPNSKEQYAAHLPALHQLCNLGWNFLTTAQALALRGSTREVILRSRLVEVLQTRRYEYKGQWYPLSSSGIEQVVRELSSAGKHNEFAEIKPGICEREWNQATQEDVEATEAEAKAIYDARHKKADGRDLTADEATLLDAQPIFHGDSNDIDVNHAFWVPEARLKIDAIAGLRTYVQWEPTRVTGPNDRFQVVCAELCGSGHNGMRTDMCVVDAATFDWWIKLDEPGRRAAMCVNLRLLSCFGADVNDRDTVIGKLNALTKTKPGANCDEAEEAAA